MDDGNVAQRRNQQRRETDTTPASPEGEEDSSVAGRPSSATAADLRFSATANSGNRNPQPQKPYLRFPATNRNPQLQKPYTNPGPMGTVWCAAHLQHRLRKTDYTRTNILSTIECIMFPEVPIALRMSGHLLLGVVRIYSKQVDYFFQDCNYLDLRLKKALLSMTVNLPEGATYDIVTNGNLPEGATQATYNSITLPETFQLDALQSDYDLRAERFVDTHLKPQEEITLEDQVPIGGDQYVAIYIDEDEGRELSTENIASGLQATPMEIDPHPPVGEGTPGGPRHSPPSTPGGLNEGAGQEAVAQEFPETEVMRDASHDVGVPSTPMWQDRRDDVLEPDLVLAEQVTEDDQNVSSVAEGMLPSGGRSSPPQRPEHPSASAEVGQGNTSSPPSFGKCQMPCFQHQ
nr:sister chromatid cohesion 1 protein 3 [Ipomoea batatas]